MHMADGDGKSDRYNFEDPRQILDNFFNPGGTRMPKVFKRGGKGGKDTGEPSRSSDGDLQEMLQDSCIDWGGLSAREVAADLARMLMCSHAINDIHLSCAHLLSSGGGGGMCCVVV